MDNFRDFLDFDDVKTLVMNVLDPKETLDWDSKSILTMPLSDFKTRNELLSEPELSGIINKLPNRAAVVQAVKGDGATVGNLLAMLSKS